MSYDYILQELTSPNVTKTIDAHKWLTLTDGTIIDFTGEAYHDIIHGRGNYPVAKCHQVIRLNTDTTSGNHRPFLIGSDFLYKTGSIIMRT